MVYAEELRECSVFALWQGGDRQVAESGPLAHDQRSEHHGIVRLEARTAQFLLVLAHHPTLYTRTQTRCRTENRVTYRGW